MFKFKLTFTVVLSMFGLSMQGTPTPAKMVRGESWKVLHFVGLRSQKIVRINAGEDQKIRPKTKLHVFRMDDSKDSKPVPIGILQVLSVADHTSLAKIIKDTSPMSIMLFPEYPGIMAGDRVTVPRFAIRKNQKLVPEITMPYSQLFQDPNPDPISFELSEKGKEQLKKHLKVITNQKSGLIFVQGYTDPEGDKARNQLESYERAKTIRQFLIESLNIKASRIVAIGKGELDPADRSNLSGSKEANRRIVFKVVSP